MAFENLFGQQEQVSKKSNRRFVGIFDKPIETPEQKFNKLVEESWKVSEKAEEEIKQKTSIKSILKGTVGLGEPGLGAVGKIGKTIGGYLKAVATHPKEVAKGVYESAVLKPISFAQKILQPGFEQKPTEEIIGKPEDKEAEQARNVGDFLGWLVPYSKISQAASFTFKTLTKAPKIVKYIPAISDAIGFIGTGQVLYEDEEGTSRLKQLRNDVIALGIFKAASKGFQMLKKPVVKEIDNTIKVSKKDLKNLLSSLKETEQKTLKDIQVGKKTGVDLRIKPENRGKLMEDIKAIETKLFQAEQAIKNETGLTIKEHLQKDIMAEVKPVVPKIPTAEIKPKFTFTEKVQRFSLADTKKPVLPKVKAITKELAPLAKEARKYASAEKFSKAWDIDGMRGRYWHITDDINFKPKAGYAPSGAIGQPGKYVGQKDPLAGLIISSDPANWLPFARARKYMAEIDLSKAKPNIDYTIVNRGFGQEVFVKNLDNISVKSVKPINQAMADVRQWEKLGFKSKEEAINFYTQAVKGVKEVLPKVKPSVLPVKKVGKPSKIALSIEAKAIEKDLTKGFKDLAEYTPTTIKQQARKMATLMKDIEKAKKVALGTEPLPQGLNSATVITTMEKYALKNRDGELMAELARSPLVSETSAAAQTLRLTAEREPESAVRKIREVIKARETGLERRLKFTKPEKLKENIKKSLEKEIKKAKPKKHSWENLISEIVC